MQETKFLLHGQFHRANGWIMNDCLGYIKATKQEAIATCKRNNPEFMIHTITVKNEHNCCNISDSSNNRRGTFVILKRYAHTS